MASEHGVCQIACAVQVLAAFAGVGNTDGVRHLLDLGVDVGAVFEEGDGYWDVAEDSTALHVEALLRAGASVSGVAFPSGYAHVDALLRSHGAGEYANGHGR